MSRIPQSVLSTVLLVGSLLAAPFVYAQEKRVAPPAPLPSEIFRAKKAFISNGGLDGIAFQAFHKLGDVNQPYNAFYAAMKEWGKYSLVSSPAEADLVFEIRFNAPFNGDEHVPSYVPQFNLTIYDAKTRFVLWTMLAPVQGAFRRETFIRNVNEGIAILMADLRNLHAAAASSAPPATK